MSMPSRRPRAEDDPPLRELVRARPLELQVRAWIERYAARVIEQALRDARVPASERARLREQLILILRTHGLRIAGDAAKSLTGGEPIALPATLTSEFLERKTVLVQGIEENAERIIRRQLADRIAEYRAEHPRPSLGEQARRIRTEWYGKGGGRVRPGARGEEVGGGAILPTERLVTRDGAALYSFASSRAALIARTEAVQAGNFGIVAGASAVGADGLEWMAVTSGETWPRRHDLMDGVRVKLGEPFVLPPHEDTGEVVEMMYPGDPAGGIGQIANCRCSVRPVFLAAERTRFERKRARR
jgi:hypothetical protein